MMGMKYSFDARLEFARRLSAIFQRSASNFSMPWRWSAVMPPGSCLPVWSAGLAAAATLTSIFKSPASLRLRPL